MAGEATQTVWGRLAGDPDLRYTPSGAPVANFTVVHQPRQWDKDQGKYVDAEPMFVRCVAWREMAENITESLGKGMRAIVHGTWEVKGWEDKEGNKRTSWELKVEAGGPDLRFDTAQVSRGGGGASQSQGFASAPMNQGGGWNTPAQPQGQQAGGWGADPAEPPF